MPYAEESRQFFFEGVVETPGGEPAVEGGVHHELDFFRADELAGGRNGTLARAEFRCLQCRCSVAADEFGNFLAQGVGRGVGHEAVVAKRLRVRRT